jgi:hypothetical protein
MADRAEDFDIILHRAVTVFGNQTWTAVQLAIETHRRNAEVAEAIEALVAAKRLERVEGRPVTYKVAANG